MNFNIEGQLLETILEVLKSATDEIAKSREKIQLLEANRLLTEQQAQVYLSRDGETLRYYRHLGLDSFKKGKDRWYLKGDIDAWLASGKVSRHK